MVALILILWQMMNVRLSLNKNDIYFMGEVLDIPDTMKCPNDIVVDEMETLSVLCKRSVYPCRFADMVARFGRPVP